MVSKARVTLIMLGFLVLALAVIGLLAAVGAGAVWYRIAPIGVVLLFGAFLGQSLGWFKKKTTD